jgi:hypothetical protein
VRQILGQFEFKKYKLAIISRMNFDYKDLSKLPGVRFHDRPFGTAFQWPSQISTKILKTGKPEQLQPVLTSSRRSCSLRNYLLISSLRWRSNRFKVPLLFKLKNK